ncbi:ABC transporter substrate-binding protein [Spirochaetia bacterium]|nr:ABC transporter substrate-binding protein [Spirochaetia bacterium]
MKRFGLFVLVGVLAAAGVFAGPKQDSSGGVKASWFSDVSFWNPPANWNLDENTITGTISKATGVQFEMNIPPEDGASKLSLMLISGNLPDVMSVTDATLIKELVASGKVWKMEEFLKQYDPQSHLLRDFPEDVKQAMIFRDGGWYAYPSHINSADARKQFPSIEFYNDDPLYRDGKALMWNLDLLARAGLNQNELLTEAQVLAAWKKVAAMNLTVDGAPVIPLLVDGTRYQDHTLSFLYNSFGAEEVDRNGNYSDRILTPQAKHALSFFNGLVRDGILDPNQLTIDNSQVKAYIASGRVLSFIGNTPDTGIDQAKENFWSAGPIVSADGARPVLGKSLQATSGWISTFISRSAKNPEALAKWLSWMSSPEGMMLAINGFPGVHYNLNSQGLVVYTEKGQVDRDNFTQTGVNAYWPFHHSTWSFSNTLPPPAGHKETYNMQIQCAVGKYKDTAIYDASLLARPSGLIDPNSDLGITELQITNYKKPQIATVITAKTPADFEQAYNTLIAQLQTLGIASLDARINEGVQGNYRLYNSRIQKVNN